MAQDNQSTATLAQLNSINTPVTVRTTSWLDLAMRAWGAEWNAPDHNTYQFSQGRNFDSTDKARTGIYGVEVDEPLSFEPGRYPDMDSNLQVSNTGDMLDLSN